ncbi:MAG: AAA family ATPase [Cyanobacteriota bacterium]
MEEKKLKNLPLGIQTFKDIIEANKLYVDKTEEIYNLLETDDKYFFLSRPRRFGKSLLISTLQEIFLGNKELFKGLWIYDKIEFKKHPVIKLTMNDLIYSEGVEGFKSSLFEQIKAIYKNYNIKLETDNHKIAFKNLIQELSKTEKVVLLIDEYDKPIIEYIENIEKAIEMRKVLKEFYETIKANDEYLHFVFLTGVSKFSKVSIFSALNNLTDITLSDKFANIVGITEKQLYSYFDERITILAKKLNVTEEKLKKELKNWYNGYSWNGKDFLYNPYSLLLLFENQQINNYWFETGSPTFLIKMIKEYDIDIKKLENCVLSKNDFSTYEVDDMNVYALLFQTGYLTIKEIIEYDITDREYILSYPNMEVKDSLLKSILIDMTNKKSNEISISRIIRALKSKNLDEFFKLLIALFGTIPNQIHPHKGSNVIDKEFYYHTIFHIIFTLIGVRVKSEVSVSKGFVDSVVETDDTIFIFEFKLGKKSNIAIEQIQNKKYYESYLSCNKEIYLIGVSFDMKERNIVDYLVKKHEYKEKQN